MVSLFSVRIIASIIVLCVVASISAALWLASANDVRKKDEHQAVGLTEMVQYTSEKNNFSFSYPNTHQVIEYSPDALVVATMSGQTVMGVAQIRVLTTSEIVDLEKYAGEEARSMCSSETAEYVIECTDILETKPSVTDSGITGIEFYIHEQKTDLHKNESIEESKKGPFFAYSLTPHTVVMVYPPQSISQKEVNTSMVSIIAESVTLPQ